MPLRTFLLACSCWLLAGPALAYFSKSGRVDGLSYRIWALTDRHCQHELSEAKLAQLDQELEQSQLKVEAVFRGCFAAVFDVEVEKPGLYTFANNGFIQKMALFADGRYRQLPTYYENDSVIADLALQAGHYRIYSSGQAIANLPTNRWGVGNAPYMVKPTIEYHRASFLVVAVRGICFGILCIMAAFFLFMTRENNRVFLIYGSFIAVNVLFIESLRGLVAELLGFKSGLHYFPEWVSVVQTFGALTQLFMGIFFAAFYELRAHYPRFHRFFQAFYANILLEIPLTVFKWEYAYLHASLVIIVGATVLVGTAVWYSISRGGLYHLIVIGYGVMLSFSQYFVLTYIGVIQVESIWGRDMHLIGSTVEVILFSVATSLKLNGQFAQQKKQKNHVQQQLEKIVYPHQLQRIRDGASLEQTMPTGKAAACVLTFDIIGSSRLQHDNIKDFIEQAIDRCVATMHERYDASKLEADAYRIKLVGDGFLCSVGFPFHTPDAMPVNEAAVRLALRMVAAFNRVEADFDYPEPIYCSIGIAHGPIEAYYPRSGTKAYDLYGIAILLATRYEQLRKQLVSPERADYIFLHEQVYESLSPELQTQFDCIDLEERQIRVRDDDAAQRVYVWQSYVLASTDEVA